MDRVLGALPKFHDPNVLVGYDTADDAGVYRLSDELALVQTVDFFTPIVDDPYTFGAIAAVNSLSDVYAMGGRPISALSIVAYPGDGDMDDLGAILRGGLEKMREADTTVLGGHSVNDPEIKFGYAVTGTVHPARVKANAGARAGDVILFTKAIGTGVIGTAIKRGIASEAAIAAATNSMLQLNRAACEAMLQFDVHGCTDITGFGLIGHAREVAIASAVTVEIDSSAVPLLEGAMDAALAGAIPGGLRNNREFASCDVEVEGTPSEAMLNLLYDPQTAGGLFITLSERDAVQLERLYPAARRIGRVLVRDNKAVRIL